MCPTTPTCAAQTPVASALHHDPVATPSWLSPAGLSLLAGLWVCSAPTWAQDQLTAEALKKHAGTYSATCKDLAAPRLTIQPNSLVYGQGGRTITGQKVTAAYSYFGNSTPPGFQVALLSNIKNNDNMSFLVFEDKQGRYITLEAEGKLAAGLGKARLAAKYRACDAAASAGTAPAPKNQAVAPPSSGAAMPEYGFDLYGTAPFKAAWAKAAGPLLKERWLGKLDGPTGPTSRVTVDGAPYVMADLCKQHDCYDHNVLFLYAPAQGQLYAQVHQQGKVTLVGAPPPAVAAELGRLWSAQFRRK